MHTIMHQKVIMIIMMMIIISHLKKHKQMQTSRTLRLKGPRVGRSRKPLGTDLPGSWLRSVTWSLSALPPLSQGTCVPGAYGDLHVHCVCT